MAIVPKKLYHGEPSSELEVLYLAAGNKTIVKNILLSKTGDDPPKIDLYVIPSGDTESSSNKVISNLEIDQVLVSIDTSLVLESGDSIKALNKGDGPVSIYISGVEVI